MSAPADSARSRRSWPQRLLIAFNVVCIIGAVTVAGVLGYANDKLAEVVRIDPGGALRDPEQTGPGDPQNFLLVGADDSAGLSTDDPAAVGRGDIAGVRTDVILILRVEPESTDAQLLSIPRDLWVPISGTGTSSRINSALETRGVGGLIDTIYDNFGIPIDHYVQIDFAGFKRLVAAIDGVPIYFAQPVRDLGNGLVIDATGCVTLDPNQALAFVRSRKYQERVDGEWEFAGRTNDLGRANRQQFFLRVALRRAIDKGVRNLNTMANLIDIGVDSVRPDDDLTAEALLDLGQRFRRFSPGELATYSLPVVDDVRGEAEVLDLVDEEAEPILDIFRGSASAGPGDLVDLTPDDIGVAVRNGSNVAGQATEVTDAFSELDFPVGPPTDAEELTAETILRYEPSDAAGARLVARYVAGPVTFEAVDELDDEASVVLITGSEFSGIRDEPKPIAEVADPVTETTASSTTTSTPTSTATSTATSATSTTDAPGRDDTATDGADDQNGDSSVPGGLPGPAPPGVSCS